MPNSDCEIEYLDEDADIVQQCVQTPPVTEDTHLLQPLQKSIDAEKSTPLLVERRIEKGRKRRKRQEDDSDYDPNEDIMVTSPPQSPRNKKKRGPLKQLKSSEQEETKSVKRVKQKAANYREPVLNRKKCNIRIPDYEDPLCLPVKALKSLDSDMRRLENWNNVCLEHFKHCDSILKSERGETQSSSRILVLKNLMNKQTEFINVYETEPILWDPREPGFKKKYLRHEAWLRIKNTLGWSCTLNDLKKQRNSLMAYYRQILNKHRKSGAGTDDIQDVNWFAFGALHKFLQSIYDRKQTVNTENQEDDDGNTDQKRSYSNRNAQTKEKLKLPPKIADAREQLDEAYILLKNSYTDMYSIFGKLIARKIRKLKNAYIKNILMDEIHNMVLKALLTDGNELLTETYKSADNDLRQRCSLLEISSQCLKPASSDVELNDDCETQSLDEPLQATIQGDTVMQHTVGSNCVPPKKTALVVISESGEITVLENND